MTSYCGAVIQADSSEARKRAARAQQTGRPRSKDMEEAADLLYMLTSFSTYDTLAGPKRGTEKVTALVQRVARESLGVS